MRKILVAEDEQNIREFVVINLERAGYQTVEAETGDQALQLYDAENGSFDVAVLDIMMPGAHDGLAVCKELRGATPPSASFCSPPAPRRWTRSLA